MRKLLLLSLTCAAALSTAPLHAGVLSTLGRETTETALRTGARIVGKETAEQLSENALRMVLRHGEECRPLLKRAGPLGERALEQAGEQAPDVIRLYARCGEETLHILSKPNKLALFLKHGDSAASALLRHPGIAEDVITKFGPRSAEALMRLSQREAQRLGIMTAEGSLERMGRTEEVFALITRLGDRAMEFIWRNKGALAVGSTLALFLSKPEVFIDGVQKLVVEPMIKPIATQAAAATPWGWLISGGLFLLFLPTIVRRVSDARSSAVPQTPAPHDTPSAPIPETATV